jgi:prepilin-type N-terminal cleavage/methylation domain-containing protein
MRGFSLIELAFVVLIMGLLAAASSTFFLEDWRRKKTDITAAEIWAIGTAAQKYSADNGAWPDRVNLCSGALAVLLTDGYLGAIDAYSPWYEATSNPGGQYVVACDDNALTVTVTTTTEWAGYIANNLAVTTAAGADTITVFPLAAAVPALAGLLHRDFDPAHPEYNQMNTDLVMGDGVTAANSITNAMDVELAPEAVGGKGRSLSQAVQDVVVAYSGDAIDKPVCPPGKVPQIFVAPSLFVGGDPARAIGGVSPRATHLSATQWQVFLEVLTKDGWISDPALTEGRIIVMTKCT